MTWSDVEPQSCGASAIGPVLLHCRHGELVDPLTTLLATTTTATAACVAVRVRKQRHRRAVVRGRLDPQELGPLDIGHLSPKLGRLATGARTVRLLLETPLHRYECPTLQETPWRRRERLDEYDRTLSDARRALWEWLLCVSSLDAEDISLLRRLRLDPRPLRALVYKPGVFDRTQDVFDETWFPVDPDVERLVHELCEAMMRLEAFERALVEHRPTPYR